MAKKKLAPKAARGARGGASAAKSGGKTNPFELKGSRRKFEVLGRREKAGKNNVIASREAAVAKVRFDWLASAFRVRARLLQAVCACVCCRPPLAAAAARRRCCFLRRHSLLCASLC
jgi:hypothetical protein